MDLITSYTMAMAVLIPAFSSAACAALIAFALQDCLTWEEMMLKKITFAYFVVEGIAWCITFCYPFCPALFVCLNALCLLSYVLIPVFFYRVIRYLTRLGQPENFSPLHYLIPGLLAAVMLVWSFLVPFDVQVEIVKGKALVFPRGYETYAHFFTLKFFFRLLWGVVYYILTIALLAGYYRKAGNQNLKCKPARWILFLIGISLTSLISSLLPAYKPRGEILYSFGTLLVTTGIAAQQILLSYHIIRRKYMLYYMPEIVEKPVAETRIKPWRKQHTGKLNRIRFENFIGESKPYLNPDYKIIDLVEDMDVNRTALSAFINRTYGVNFNRYLNRLRLKELARLRSQPENQGKSISSLIDKVGFKDFRNYSRAVAAERDAATERKEAGKKKGGLE